MIISDGTTSITITGTRHDDFLELEKSRNISAGGKIKSQTSGKRFKVVENVRMTAANYDILMGILDGTADAYYYTPTNTPGYLSASDFPMRCNIDVPKKTGFDFNGQKYYQIELVIESESYIA